MCQAGSVIETTMHLTVVVQMCEGQHLKGILNTITDFNVVIITCSCRKSLKTDPYAGIDGVGGGVWVNFHAARR